MHTKRGGYRRRKPNPYLQHPYRCGLDDEDEAPQKKVDWPLYVFGALGGIALLMTAFCTALLIQEII